MAPKPSKRNILWVVPLIIIGIFYWVYGPKDDITDNETITYVKNHALPETNNTKVQLAFEKSCKNPYWEFFETQRGQDVVEFTGECPHGDKNGKVNVQFLVDDEQTSLRVGAILFNSIQLKDQEKNQFLESLKSSS